MEHLLPSYNTYKHPKKHRASKHSYMKDLSISVFIYVCMCTYINNILIYNRDIIYSTKMKPTEENSHSEHTKKTPNTLPVNVYGKNISIYIFDSMYISQKYLEYMVTLSCKINQRLLVLALVCRLFVAKPLTESVITNEITCAIGIQCTCLAIYYILSRVCLGCS